MNAAAGLGDSVQVSNQPLLALPRRAVDPLELRVLLVASPVGAGTAEQLERRDEPGGPHVRAAAQVDELLVAIEGDHPIAHSLAGLTIGDDLALVGLIGKQR